MNPTFAATLTDAQLAYVTLHEKSHVAHDDFSANHAQMEHIGFYDYRTITGILGLMSYGLSPFNCHPRLWINDVTFTQAE